jgi:PIN domain nuclease of toxin-antitoxin system
VSGTVLDASALIAMLNEEPGADRVRRAAVAGSKISTLNYAEAGTRLLDIGERPEVVDETLRLLGVEIVGFDTDLAVSAVALRSVTRPAGLSLADRACLALAMREDAVALTADRAWGTIDLDCRIELIR